MIPFPVARSLDALAEWVEAETLFGEVGSVSRIDLLNFIRDEPTEDEGENRDAYEAELERTCDDVWGHVEARARVSGSRYPLKISAAVVERRTAWSEDPWIGLLFLLSLRGWYKIPIAIQPAARLFERLVTCALLNFVGGPDVGGDARRFGWPVDADETDFEVRVRSIGHAINARFVSLTGVSRSVKDHELDVIAWRRFPDERTGALVILCQCGIGQDWIKKTLNASQWLYVLQMIPPPITALAIPFVPESDEDWRAHWDNVGTKGSLGFDRLRLTRYLQPACDEPDGQTRRVLDWLVNTVGGLETATPRGAVDEPDEG